MRFRSILRKALNSVKPQVGPKIFCIGLNKTGTTSLKKAWEELGISVGDEPQAKYLFGAWARRDFKPIVEFCKSAQAFQDSPFSLPFTFIALDQAYPGSKFILTVRDDREGWYNSLVRFHSKLWGEDGEIPTKQELMQAVNGYKGRPWEVNRVLFNTPEEEPYQKAPLLEFYDTYVSSVKEYFKGRESDLLVINVKHESSYHDLCKFIGKQPVREVFPWENKT